MELDSYLEIFTTMYGWAFANIIGEVLTGTGLAALPFGLIVFSVWKDAKESASGGAGAQELVDAVLTRIFIAMFVYMTCFAVTPYTSLVSVNLRYTPQPSLNEPNPVTGSLNTGTGSTFDNALRDARDGSMSPSGGLSEVPAWWFTVMAISSGINNAVRSGLSSARSDVRMVEDMARTATIEDPRLLEQIQRFYSECFIPARSRFLRTETAALSANAQGILAESNADYGPTDVDWMGSQLFRTEAGFYGTMRSYDPVPGFMVVPSRDTDYIAGGAPGTPEAAEVNPDWGRPTCLEWWLDGTNGVRTRMVNHASSWQRLYQNVQSAMSWSSTDRAADSVAMLAQQRANPQFLDASRIMGNDYDGITNLVRGIGGAISTFGVGKKLLDATIEFVPMINALPMVQSMLLMGMYMFLPMIVLLSGYDLKIMLLGGLAIFTVKFWSVMWFIAQWLDARLIQAMYPGLNGNMLMQEIQAVLSGGEAQGYKRMILNLVLMSLFIGLPVLWSAMMAWIGLHAGRGLDNIARSSAVSGVSAGTGSTSTKAVAGVARRR
ncbi:MAG: conjugal transfer protein TraG [Variovorax paradoxus]|nr:MAG: conjugal transfer protein TraG [Variovorax paradoxus]PZQ09648.1 MAG: conjugal transfer protein TraG [Variovorax paradoxus]